MSRTADKDDPEKSDKGELQIEEYARARREGAFISPCGTEGCQWDGFPEPPDDEGNEKEP